MTAMVRGDDLATKVLKVARPIEGDNMMPQAAKPAEIGLVPSQGSSEGDVLLFLKRTLRFHSSADETEDIFAKLQNLKKALDQQETTLLSWPESASKDRICGSLAKAKAVVAQIVGEFGRAASK